MGTVCLSTSDMFGAMLFVFGTFISFFSLTFFISRPKIGTNEFMFLSLDTMNVVICLYLVGSIPSIRDTYLYHLAYQFHDPILYLSLFIACLMSISRMILLLFPSAQPLLRIRYLLVGIFLFILILALPFIVQPEYFLSGRVTNPLWATYHSLVALLVVIVALVCSGMIAGTLKFGTNHEDPAEKMTTVTVLILAFTKALFVAPYCLLFLVSSIVDYHRSNLRLAGQDNYNVPGPDNALVKFLDIWVNYAMPINSVINVIVCFVRIRELRTYAVRVIKFLYKLTHCDCEIQKKEVGSLGITTQTNVVATPPPSPSAPQSLTLDTTPV